MILIIFYIKEMFFQINLPKKSAGYGRVKLLKKIAGRRSLNCFELEIKEAINGRSDVGEGFKEVWFSCGC